MSRRNGGIIGPTNTPVGGLISGSAGGVWRMYDVLTFVTNSQWPKTPQSIDNSCIFNNDDTAYLSFTPSAAGNKKTWTWSGWVKLGHFDSSNNRTLFSSRQDSSNSFEIKFDNNDKIHVRGYVGGSKTLELSTSQLFRDTSAWYHIVYALDTTNGTASNRQHLYINGSEVTSFGTETNPSQDNEYEINEAQAHQIGAENGGNLYDGYMAEVVFIDGQQLTPSSFGEFDSTTGIWKPKKIGSFTSAGSNSFYLNFKDSSTLGKDESGLSNNFTVNGIASTDQSTDTCVVNYATLNSLYEKPQTNPSELRDGNTSVIGGSAHRADVPTIAMNAGKWYFEAKAISGNTTKWWWGLGEAELVETKQDLGNTSNFIYGDVSNTQGVYDNNLKVDGSTAISSIFGAACAANDIVMLAVDFDTQKVWYGLNGTWNNGSATASTTFNSSSPDSTAIVAGDYYYFGVGNENTKWSVNYGNPAYSISSSNADANGHGNFEYAVPSGFYALNTSNINTYG